MRTVMCKRCGVEIPSYSPMRKWCFKCRRIVSMEQAKQRKQGRKSNK